MLTANRLLVANGFMLIVYVPLMMVAGMVGLGLVMGLVIGMEYLWRGGRLLVGLPWETQAEVTAKEQEAKRKALWQNPPWMKVKVTEAERRRAAIPEYGAAANRRLERLHSGRLWSERSGRVWDGRW